MKFVPGDSVSFINEKQDGIVKRILPGNIIMVEIEDGFEIPARENELVKKGNIKLRGPEVVMPVEQPLQKIDSGILSVCSENSLVIAAVPDAEGGILTGPLTYFLVNKTGFDVAFTIYESHQKKKTGIGCNICKKGEFIELKKYNRNDLTDVNSFIFHGLLYSTTELPLHSQIKKEFGTLLPNLQHARSDLAGTVAFAATVTLFTDAADEEIPVKDLIEKFRSAKDVSTVNKPKTVNSEMLSPDKFGIHINEKEVDLHIEELVTDFSGLSNAEMVKIQLNKFSKEMDNAIRHHYKKIIFIHGVGNGKLKSEIRNELRLYAGVAFRDGDPRKYGQGATEVIFT